MEKRADVFERIVKVPFPVSVIRRMDEAVVAERGGFRTRAELMREAVENLLDELDFPEAPAVEIPAPRTAERASGAGRTYASRGEEDLSLGLAERERDELKVPDLLSTVLRAPEEEPQLLTGGSATVRDEPLLGLHNRDYVSIWALHRLARYTSEGSIDFDEYLDRVTKAAWYVGHQLRRLEQEEQGRKLTILFPTNLAKRPSAERGFQNFAVGSLTRKGDCDDLSAAGPLFAWRAIQTITGGSNATGLTSHGLRLLQELEGISLELPHSPILAQRFLGYLAEHAPADRWGFDQVLQVAADAPDREGLVRHFSERHPEWTAATAGSVAQGYVARAREWGLLEPRLVDGRYWLTETGRELVREINETLSKGKESVE
jgi:Arc/MetJ-type ribon-helix-helix transcriptional regulator